MSLCDRTRAGRAARREVRVMDETLAPETQLRLAVNAGRMAEDVKVLAALGPRHAATEREHEAARYIEDQFRRTGAEVRVDQVPGVKAWYHHESRMQVLGPGERQELNCVAILGSASTPAGGTTAEVIHVGRGLRQDLAGLDVRNKFVLRDPPRNLTLDNPTEEDSPQGSPDVLARQGVVGFIEYARQPGRILQTDLLSGPQHLPVPAVALTYEDGQYLKELIREWYATPNGYRRLQDEPVKAWLYVNTESRDSYGLNVIASIRGSDRPDEKVLLVAHHDNAFGPGACDNATAVAVNLECARALARLHRPRSTIECCSVTGEEYGEFGSSAYVKRYVTDPSRYKGVIVMDIIGNGDHLYYITRSLCLGKLVENTPWLNRLLERVTADLGYVIEPMQLEFASDDGPFLLAGVPTAYLCKLITPSWPWLHTNMDDFQVVDINGMKVVAEIAAVTLWRLANQ
jgi:aminopeptidase YwaD